MRKFKPAYTFSGHEWFCCYLYANWSLWHLCELLIRLGPFPSICGTGKRNIDRLQIVVNCRKLGRFPGIYRDKNPTFHAVIYIYMGQPMLRCIVRRGCQLSEESMATDPQTSYGLQISSRTVHRELRGMGFYG